MPRVSIMEQRILEAVDFIISHGSFDFIVQLGGELEDIGDSMEGPDAKAFKKLGNALITVAHNYGF